ncbi:MAG: hypothetical protein ACI86M_002207 [Saprospiraceae bacterium]|jgi:hypothetical protein
MCIYVLRLASDCLLSATYRFIKEAAYGGCFIYIKASTMNIAHQAKN